MKITRSQIDYKGVYKISDKNTIRNIIVERERERERERDRQTDRQGQTDRQ